MTGHKSTVSSLVVADGVLYSGSWDGTIRLWWLSDHSPLSVLGDDNTPGSFSPILSLSAQSGWVISSYENGFIKVCGFIRAYIAISFICLELFPWVRIRVGRWNK